MDTALEEKVKIKIAPIKMYDIIFFNDDYTPMDFVVRLLMTIFNHSIESATEIMLKVHESGSAVVGTYIYEIADEKRSICLDYAKQYKFPLRVEMEESSSEA